MLVSVAFRIKTEGIPVAFATGLSTNATYGMPANNEEPKKLARNAGFLVTVYVASVKTATHMANCKKTVGYVSWNKATTPKKYNRDVENLVEPLASPFEARSNRKVRARKPKPAPIGYIAEPTEYPQSCKRNL